MPQGTNNPLLLRKLKAQSRPQGSFLSLPFRPSHSWVVACAALTKWPVVDGLRAAADCGGAVAAVKGTTIKDYLSRPRPTLDEIHKIMKERDAKNLQLERWETEMGRDWRATLDENRAQVRVPCVPCVRCVRVRVRCVRCVRVRSTNWVCACAVD